ncbi:MAG: hypothetical protein ABR991_04505 [Terracidiphilus sp.]
MRVRRNHGLWQLQPAHGPFLLRRPLLLLPRLLGAAPAETDPRPLEERISDTLGEANCAQMPVAAHAGA